MARLPVDSRRMWFWDGLVWGSGESLWVDSPADGVAARATLDSELFGWRFANWPDTLQRSNHTEQTLGRL